MEDKTTKDMVKELYREIIGIPENPDENGLIGEVKQINVRLANLNGSVLGNRLAIEAHEKILREAPCRNPSFHVLCRNTKLLVAIAVLIFFGGAGIADFLKPLIQGLIA